MSCGPKFEPEEKEEYLAKRQEFFPTYLARFTTVDSFKEFGRDPQNHYRGIFTTQDENATGSEAFVEIYKAKASEALSASEQKLEKLVTLYKEAGSFLRNDSEVALVISLDVVLKLLSNGVRECFLEELAAAQATEKSIPEVLEIFQKLGRNHMREFGLNSSVWEWLLTRTTSVDDLLIIEQKLEPSFTIGSMLEPRLGNLVETAIQELDSFAAAVEYARIFANRDRAYAANQVYTKALAALASRASAEEELVLVLGLYSRRKDQFDTFTRNSIRPSHTLYQKWDNLHLNEARMEEDIARLGGLLNNAPESSETRRVASKRLNKHFATLLAEATTESEVDEVNKSAEALSRHIRVATHERKEELKQSAHAKHVGELWTTFESGHPFEDERTVLKGLFHEFDKKDPERARRVLLRLMKYFPAEDVEEVAVEAE
jgi:hypothetical protein